MAGPRVGDTREGTCLFCKQKTPQVLRHSWANWAAWECQHCTQHAQTNVYLEEAPQRQITTDWVEFPNGSDTIQGYLAAPSAPGRYPALVQVHENLGIIDHRRDMTARLARLGIVALTPNLYSRIGGQPPQDYATQEERRRKAVLTAPHDQAQSDVIAAHAYLSQRPDVDPERIGIIGFCMGGTIALRTVCTADGLFKVFVCFYGALTKRAELTDDGQPVHYLPLVRDLSCPIQFIVGCEDEIIPQAEVDELERLLKEHHKDYEIHRFDGAKHAFHDDTNRRYAPQQAAEAQKRAFDYLAERLQGAARAGA
jgi:carboxymethylenebutenolidase